MANLGGEVDQRELDLQRDVVKNEMRQNVLDSAGAPGVEALRAALFPAPHPYAESVIGSIADLDAAKLEDVKAFFDAYYVPNNAVLSLAGDFEVEAVKAIIADTFGRVPRGADVAVPEAATPEPVAVRLDFTDRLPAPVVMLAAAGPPVDTVASVALVVAGDLLGNYEYGVLRRELVNTGLAINASANWDRGPAGWPVHDFGYRSAGRNRGGAGGSVAQVGGRVHCVDTRCGGRRAGAADAAAVPATERGGDAGSGSIAGNALRPLW